MTLNTDPTLEVGNLVRFDDDYHWWVVKAVSDRYQVCTRENRKGTKVRYTIIDRSRGVRGPCNLIGGGYGDGRFDLAECADMLRDLETNGPDHIEVSWRNNVPLRFHSVHAGARAEES